MSNVSWRVDETYVKVKGRWMYLYRAVDSRGQTIDFMLSAKRDADAAKRFFRKATVVGDQRVEAIPPCPLASAAGHVQDCCLLGNVDQVDRTDVRHQRLAL